MKHLGILATVTVGLVAALSAATGCSSSSTGGTAGNTTTTSSHTGTAGNTTTTSGTTTSTTSGTTTTTSSHPAPPTIGTQIDRFGRPAINTALTHAFDATAATAGAAKDAYNQDSDPTKWVGANSPEFAKNLAILDALDTVCGNQLLAAAPPITATRYSTLAGALADDRVWLNTAGATCTTYLAVEANATGIKTNADCGGRTLEYDVIDTSYSALAAGAFTGVGDGVAANDVANTTTFPYLAAPH
jgi:hypothetical protein